MRVLAIFSAYGGCRIGAFADGVCVARHQIDSQHGLPGALAEGGDAVLRAFGAPPEAIGVCVGPGSFTGLRAGLAFATGVGIALAIPVCGVTAAEALRRRWPPGRPLWIAIEARRDRVFLDCGEGPEGRDIADLPNPPLPVAIGGNAAMAVAARLAARGADVMLTRAVAPSLEDIAAIAEARALGRLPPLAALPLYVDAPEARRPTGGLRPPPQDAPAA